MYEERIKSLEVKHAGLNKKIDGLEKTGKFSDSNITELKKEKLALKDEIARLKKEQWEKDYDHLEWDDE